MGVEGAHECITEGVWCLAQAYTRAKRWRNLASLKLFIVKNVLAENLIPSMFLKRGKCRHR